MQHANDSDIGSRCVSLGLLCCYVVNVRHLQLYLQSKQSPEMLVLGMTCRDVTGEVWHADEVLAAQLLSTQLLFPRSAGDHSGEETETATEVGGCPLLAAGLWSGNWRHSAARHGPSPALVGVSMTLNNVHIYKTLGPRPRS